MDELIVIPNGIPPHKEKRISAELKLELTRITLGHIQNLQRDDRELMNMNNELKNKILESLENIKAVNPIAIDVKKISSLTDFMVIASGTSNRHLAAMSDKVIEGLKDSNVSGVKIEGQGGDEWLLVDAGDVIIHLMSSEARDFYDLESLWDPDL